MLSDVVKPTMQRSSVFLDDHVLFLGAQRMLISIAEERKTRPRIRLQVHRGGNKASNIKSPWRNWVAQLRKRDAEDTAAGDVPKSNVPFESRLAAVKMLLEEERLSFVRKSLAASGAGVNDVEDQTALMSLHSVKHVLRGKVSIEELFERKRQVVMRIYAGRRIRRHLLNEIIEVSMSL